MIIQIICDDCNGTGVSEYVTHGPTEADVEPIRCPACGGFGAVETADTYLNAWNAAVEACARVVRTHEWPADQDVVDEAVLTLLKDTSGAPPPLRTQRDIADAKAFIAKHHTFGWDQLSWALAMARRVDDNEPPALAQQADAPTGVQALVEALRPFVNAYQKAADPIGDSDLDDEQPRHVTVTLGDCRRAARVLNPRFFEP